MLPFLRSFFHRPVFRLGKLDRGPRDSRRLRNERFASYLSSYNRKTINTDWQDTLLALRRLLRQASVLAGIGALVWIAVESARAVGMF